MAELSLTIGGRTYKVACRDGEEAELVAAAALLDEQAEIAASVGPAGEARTLMLAGLLLADQLREARVVSGSAAAQPPAAASPLPQADLDALTARAEKLAAWAETLVDARAADRRP